MPEIGESCPFYCSGGCSAERDVEFCACIYREKCLKNESRGEAGGWKQPN